MARPETIKTELAGRLREVRRAKGDPERDVFAKEIGISAKTLGNYERGDNVPDATALAAYRDAFGVDLNWLVSGEGSIVGARQLQQQIMVAGLNMERLELALATIERGLEEAGKVASPAVKAQLTIAAYELLAESPERAVGSVLRLVKG